MLAESFKRVEGKIYNYYDNLRNLEMLRNRLGSIEKDINDIRNFGTDSYELAASFGMTANYGKERIRGRKSVYYSPVEEAYFDMVETTEKLIARRIKLKMRIIKMEEKIDGIRYALSQLNSFEQKIVEYKYRDKMSIRQIARVLNLHKNSVERTRQKIVKGLGTILDH